MAQAGLHKKPTGQLICCLHANIMDDCVAVLRLRGLIYHMRVFFFYESAENVLSYARLNCAVFNYFYMSLDRLSKP